MSSQSTFLTDESTFLADKRKKPLAKRAKDFLKQNKKTYTFNRIVTVVPLSVSCWIETAFSFAPSNKANRSFAK